MGDTWFGSVKAATELAKRHSACILQVKTNSKLYPKDYISKALENCPKSGVALTSCASYIIQGGGNDIGCGLIIV